MSMKIKERRWENMTETSRQKASQPANPRQTDGQADRGGGWNREKRRLKRDRKL